MAKSVNYPDPESKIVLFTSKGGDMHSNAMCNRQHIKIAKSLLEHHKGHPREIEAIMAHELGHWHNMDLDKQTVLDIIYMAVFAVFLQACVNNPRLLVAFGFTQKSYFVSFYLFFKLYSVTIDYPIRRLFNVASRYYEDSADQFAIGLGYGVELRSALIRNFAANLEAIFNSHVYELAYKSHPGFLTRISTVKAQTNQ